MQLTKIPFCDFKHSGVVKVAQIGSAKPKVFKNKIFCSKINFRPQNFVCIDWGDTDADEDINEDKCIVDENFSPMEVDK